MKKYILIFLLLAFTISLSGCYKQTDENYKTPSQEQSLPAPPLIVDNDTNKPNTQQIDKIDPNIMFEQNVEIEHKGMKYKVNSATIADTTLIFNQNNCSKLAWDESFENDGSLKEGFKFIEVNMTVTNLSAQEETRTVNTHSLYSIDSEYKFAYKYNCHEMAGFDKPTVDTNSKSFFAYSFKPNETVTFNFLYIAKNEELQKKLYVLINDTGFAGYKGEDVKFVKIN